MSRVIAQEVEEPVLPRKPDEADQKPDLLWMVKPCFVYKEEYSDCKSFKARFHQYFLKGEMADCAQWKEDFDNCSKWEDRDDHQALNGVIESEKSRIRDRLKGHYGNDVWESRKEPPRDWNTQLPSDISREYESSFLKTKADDLREGRDSLGDVDQNIRDDRTLLFDAEAPSMCSIV